MSRKIIAFLGKYPRETLYSFQGKVYKGRVFPEALRQFIDFDEMLVFVTEEAKTHAFPVLTDLEDERIQSVPIPRGETTSEMWEMFDAMLERVNENDTVIFDITHGLRSAPFLVFLFAAFLKTARNVDIEAVYYGAFELGDQKENIPAPVIDLTEFVSMLDWLTATNQFIHTGDARYLASQLEKRGQDSLKPLAQTVNEISFGLDLLRPVDVSKASGRLPDILRSIPSDIPKPFSILIQRLENSYAQFGYKNAENTHDILQSQLNMINWYYQTRHTVQTISLCREWLVSLLCTHFQADMWDKDEREDIEILLAGGKRGERISRHLENWKKDHRRKRLGKLWTSEPYLLANLRNDVLHSGYRKNPNSAEEIREQTKAVVLEINAISRLWNFKPNIEDV